MEASTVNLIASAKNYIVLDIETTGLSYRKGSEITEICANKIVDGDTVSKFSKLINPGIHIPEDITAITGIDDSMVKWAPSFEEIAQEFVNFIGYDPIVGHNISFDWNNFLHSKLLNECAYDAPNKTICTMKMAKTFIRNAPDNKLGTIYTALTGKPPIHSHRAEGDVLMTTEVFKIMQKFIQDNLQNILQYCD